MSDLKIYLISLFFTITLIQSTHGNHHHHHHNNNDYVREACKVTRYYDLCIRSLSPFSHMANRNPTKWARAGVSVTLGVTERVDEYLMKLRKSNGFRGINRGALDDCIECFGDAIDELHKSLQVLRNLDVDSFETKMNDLITWMSAALTDEDTCLDGFEGKRGKEIGMVRSRVLNSTYFTSNALALVHKLAQDGMGKP